MPTLPRGDSTMGQRNSKQTFVCRQKDLLQVRGAGFKKQMLKKKILYQVELCCPQFPEEENLDKDTWEKVGEVLRTTQANPITLCLCTLIKDAIDDNKDRESSQALAFTQEQLVELSERINQTS